VPELKLTAVVTCYKDAQAIPQMHARLCAVFAKLALRYEIIFVNDCSPDDTNAVLGELLTRDPCVIAIEHSRNFGSQSAFVSGMQVASGDAVILLDGDLQDPPELIPELLAKWREGFEVVYGRRGQREGSWLFAALCRGFYRVFRGVSDVPIPLDAGDFALMDRRVVNELLELPETDQFLRGLRAWVGFRQAGVDYVRPERPFGRSTHTRLKNLWWAKKAIFSFSFLPVEALGYGAALLTALSLLAGAWVGVDALRHPEVPHGTAVIAVLIAFFGSVNLLGLGMLGEYLSKVVEETKGRPKFIRRSIRQGQRVFTSPQEMQGFLRSQRREAGAEGHAPPDERHG
jgi:polyisoprenyl-phosphate glycosyltransferase